jgi:hypothetical protein
MDKLASGPILVLLLALAVGLAFHLAYPLVTVGPGLATLFALAGALVYLAAQAVRRLLSGAGRNRLPENNGK